MGGPRQHRGLVREVCGATTFGSPVAAAKLGHQIEGLAKRVASGDMPLEAAVAQVAVRLTAHGRTRAADAYLAVAAGVSERVRGGTDDDG